jgi:outer membrane protein assembly factor BamB
MHLHAINPDGSAKWTFKALDQIQSSPSIGTDGAIYFGSYDHSLYALNPDGTQRWRSGSLLKGVSSSPSIGPDGTIYVGAAGLFAFDPNGSIRWSHGESIAFVTTAILGAGGKVYAVMGDQRGGVIQALDSQGKLLWDYPTTETPFGSPAIGLDGRLFATASDGIVYAIVETAPSNGGHGGAPWPQARGDRANTGRAGG